MSVKILVTLDKRRVRAKTGTYPVILLVRIDSNPYRYQTMFDLAEEDFNKLSTASRLSVNLQQIKNKLKSIQRGADDYLKENSPFDRLEFENNFVCNHPLFKPRKVKLRDTNPTTDGFDYRPYLNKFKIFKEDHSKPGCISKVFFEYIKRLIQEERVGSALNYQDTYNSIKKFRGNVRFEDITVSFLIQYEQWMKNNGRAKTTVGIKLRPLRTIFNEAIEIGIIKREKCYPFGRRKYQIPTGRNVKKALTHEDISAIFYYQPDCEEDKRAKDYWMFCYFANGMNPKDVAYLKYKNIQDEFIVFIRAKTERTTRNDPKPITVFITEEMKLIISRLSSKMMTPNTYLFPVMDDSLNPLEKHDRVRAFVKFINDRMKVIGKTLGIDKKVTTIVSRHSFSTQMKRAGASTEFIQEALGHTDKKTTENYLDSFENNLKKEFAQKLTMFKRLENAS